MSSATSSSACSSSVPTSHATSASPSCSSPTSGSSSGRSLSTPCSVPPGNMEVRRWIVVGVCLMKVLTPELRKIVHSKCKDLFKQLRKSRRIDHQSCKRYVRTIPPSKFQLEYESINNNARKPLSGYDFRVKDDISLAKLFMSPSMARFTGFDGTMDSSAVLSVLCEAPPFLRICQTEAKQVRSAVRNDWAHCNFADWSTVKFKDCFSKIMRLVRKIGLAKDVENSLLGDLQSWEEKGVNVCFGQPVDPELLDICQSRIDELFNEVKKCQNQNNMKMDHLLSALKVVTSEVQLWRDEFLKTQEKANRNEKDIQEIREQIEEITVKDNKEKYIFDAPDRNPWFYGRNEAIVKLKTSFHSVKIAEEPRIIIRAICGLGGVGKTSLASEYAWHFKTFYEGGVYWLSGENQTKFENSVNNLAVKMDILEDSFSTTLSKVLYNLGQIKKHWLVILDDMDEEHYSDGVKTFLQGTWQREATGSVLITTRREPKELEKCVRYLNTSHCLALPCFENEVGREFLFTRTKNSKSDETIPVVDELVQELGALPLALEQAGAYIRDLGCSFEDYLNTYKLQHTKLLANPAYPSSEYVSNDRLSVLTVWKINFDHIKTFSDCGDAASLVINVAAFLSPDSFQEEIINPGSPHIENQSYQRVIGTPIGCQQIISLLTKFSTPQTQQHDRTNFNIHFLGFLYTSCYDKKCSIYIIMNNF